MIQCYMVVIVTTFFGVRALVTHKLLQMKDNLKCLTYIVHFNRDKFCENSLFKLKVCKFKGTSFGDVTYPI